MRFDDVIGGNTAGLPSFAPAPSWRPEASGSGETGGRYRESGKPYDSGATWVTANISRGASPKHDEMQPVQNVARDQIRRYGLLPRTSWAFLAPLKSASKSTQALSSYKDARLGDFLLASRGSIPSSPSRSVNDTAPATCTVTSYSAIASAVASCTDIVLENIFAPANSSIDLTSLQNGTTVTFAGNTTFGTTADHDFIPIKVSGSDLTITGAEGHVIEGNGAAYWDGLGSNGGSSKPNWFLKLSNVYESSVTNLHIVNWPVHNIQITGSSGVTIDGLNMDNSAGFEPNDISDGLAAAHNSDGFGVSTSDNVSILNTRVINQDDCVAVTSGTNVVVDNVYCNGGHGLSIGSIGGKSDNTVDGVIFSNSVLVDSSNGCRIKSNSNTTGEVYNITYKNITMSGITDYGIDVQQDYLNGGPTGEPTNGVLIANISFIDVTGTVSGDDAYNYYVLCGDGSCTNFSYENVEITGGNQTCNYPASGCPS
ncbi:glycosyl hydrolase family 28 [Seiridium cupressi]